MRVALAILFSTWISIAHATPLYSPVNITQTTGACNDISSLEMRDRMISQNRTESLQKMNSVATFTGECGTAPQGQWMFFEGWHGNYVCLRPRLGADCAWIRRNSIGEVAEYFPGRTFEQGNKGVSCAQWAQVVKKSELKEKDFTHQWLAAKPKNVGEEFAQGMISAAIGTFTGGPDSIQVNHANNCEYYFASAREQARRLTAFSYCPALGANGKNKETRNLYNSTLKLANECAPH